MEGKVRFVADITPEQKQKFKEVAYAKRESMAKILVDFIEKEYEKVAKKG